MHCFSSSVVGYLLSIFIDIRFDIIDKLEVSQYGRCLYRSGVMMIVLILSRIL